MAFLRHLKEKLGIDEQSSNIRYFIIDVDKVGDKIFGVYDDPKKSINAAKGKDNFIVIGASADDINKIIEEI